MWRAWRRRCRSAWSADQLSTTGELSTDAGTTPLSWGNGDTLERGRSPGVGWGLRFSRPAIDEGRRLPGSLPILAVDPSRSHRPGRSEHHPIPVPAGRARDIAPAVDLEACRPVAAQPWRIRRMRWNPWPVTARSARRVRVGRGGTSRVQVQRWRKWATHRAGIVGRKGSCSPSVREMRCWWRFLWRGQASAAGSVGRRSAEVVRW
jgi:hypothetical protein